MGLVHWVMLENKKSDQESSSCPDLIPPNGEISQPLLTISHLFHVACRRFPSLPTPAVAREKRMVRIRRTRF